MDTPDLEQIGYGRILIAAGFILASLVFQEYVVAIVLTALTGLVAAAVNFFDLRFTGIELATFSTAVIALNFGAVPGALAGFFLVLIQMVFGQQMGVYVLWVVPGYVVMGFLAGTLQLPVTQLGTYLTLGLHAVFLTCTAVFTPEGISRYLPYAVGNTILNIALFTAVAPGVVNLLGAR